MVKAVVRNGLIVPRHPLPQDWTEGTEVEVDKAPSPLESSDELDRWFAELEALAAQGDPEDDRRLDEAIREIRQADEDAHLSIVKNRVKLADATVYHSERANAAVLEHLARETRGVTEIMAQAKVGIVDSVFGGADRAIEKLTSKLGFFKSIVSDILSGLARLALSPLHVCTSHTNSSPLPLLPLPLASSFPSGLQATAHT